MENLLAVPIGADHIGAIAQGAVTVQPAPGTALKASSVAPAPVPPGLLTTQTTADAGSVPLEVTAGDPEENPNVSVLFATPARTGVPLLSALTCRTRR